MDKSRFDYIIIGNGLAGFQLALAFAKDSFFDSKQIALIDSSPKNKNDKTWCFWELGQGNWDNLVCNSWNACKFYSSEKEYYIDLKDYSYKMIKSIDFYNYAKNTLNKKSNIHFFIDTIEGSDNTKVKGEEQDYIGKHIFDSRIPKAYYDAKDSYTRIYQHFKGWVIETSEERFNKDSFTVMDYRLKHNNDTTFTYVLPISKKKALIEFTCFTPYTFSDSEYDQYLIEYIEDVLKIKDYKVLEHEQGIIPMTDFPFKNYNETNLTKIGTAGGWVKGSTGYSFKHAEKKVSKIVSNIKENKLIHNELYSKKFELYDSIFLKVLKDNNKKGEWIFKQFYTKNKVKTMFRFLDEDSTFMEDLSIMSSLFSLSFIKAFFKSLKKKTRPL